MLMRWLPGLVVLRSYQRAWLRPDLVAGLTVGAMLIPQSMSYAELAGLPPEHGFYAVIVALFVYALVGTSRHLGVGPEPGTAILAATGVAAIAGGDSGRYVSLMAALALVVAAVCAVAWLLRLGYLASMLSKPVLVGYITGVGLTLLSSQIGGLTGITITADDFFPRVGQLLMNLPDVNGPTLALGAGTLTLMLVAKWRAPTVPVALIGVVAATLITVIFSLSQHGIVQVGAIPAGLPTPRLPNIDLRDLVELLPVAASVALVGFTDNVLTARAIAVDRGYRIDANQELLALGMINLSAGLSQGFPVSSSASRTAVPASLGSRTQLVGVVGSVFVIVCLVALRPWLSEIPRAALAAVIVTAAISIIDVSGFVSLWRVSQIEAILAVAAVLGVVVFGVLAGIAIAVSLSIAVTLSKVARPHDAVLGNLPDMEGWVDVDMYPTATVAEGLVVFRFDAPLFFINAERFRDRVEQALRDSPGDEDWLVLDCGGIGALDASAIDMLRELITQLGRQRVGTVSVARANDLVLDRLRRAELLQPAGPVCVHPTINAAVRAFHDRADKQTDKQPGERAD